MPRPSPYCIAARSGILRAGRPNLCARRGGGACYAARRRLRLHRIAVSEILHAVWAEPQQQRPGAAAPRGEAPRGEAPRRGGLVAAF